MKTLHFIHMQRSGILSRKYYHPTSPEALIDMNCHLTEESEWINTVFILSTVYSITHYIQRNISTILLLYFWCIFWCQNPTFSLSTSKASHIWCEITHCVGCPQSIFNPLLLLFKTLLHEQKVRVFSSGHLNLPTKPETGLPFRKKNHNN
jgi:hypothetical protein